jgi:hypothetical protein
MLDTYRPSGRFDSRALLAIVGVALAAAALAWPYQRLVDWIPFIYLNVLMTLGLGMALAFLLRWALRWGKVRSPSMAWGAAIGVVLVAVAASFYWAYRISVPDVYEGLKEYAASEGEEPVSYEEFQELFTFDEWREARVESGWSIGSVGRSGGGGLALTGPFVYAIWLVEAGILVFFAAQAARGAAAVPFCETCDRWSEPKALGPWHHSDAAALREAARKGDTAALLTPRPHSLSDETATYVVHSCPDCREGGFVDVTASRVVQSQGKTKVKSDALVRGLSVSSAQRDALLSYAYPKREPPAPAAPPPAS